MFGSNVGSLVITVETNQYREPVDAAPEPQTEQEKKDSFFLNPISVGGPKTGPVVRLWKETYD
jgi:hypothetical protein